jgi:hypothetical protein
LDRHDILTADDLPVESYLDTGNRGLFANADGPLTLHPNLIATDAQSLREQKSCLPLLCDPTRVEPFWRTLSERAQRLGFTLPSVESTHDPELSMASGNRRVAPVTRDGRRYTFVVPFMQEPLRLLSRFAIPSDLRPWIDDRRQLGVMVQRIVAHCGTLRADVAMDDWRLSDGWWAAERDRALIWRWTNGDAVLPTLGEGPGMIEVWLGETIPYPLAPPAEMECGRFTKDAA